MIYSARLATSLAVTATIFALFPMTAAADKGVSIGEAMPAFTLPDSSGGSHSLSDHKDKIVVLVCSSHNCPWSRGVAPHLAALAKNYMDKGVVFFGLDSDRTNTPESIKEYAEKVGIPYPILKDAGNKYADVLGAARTPEVFIVDGTGTLVYHGAYDNRTSPEDLGSEQYMARALDELLAGEAVSQPEKSAWGCSIRREIKLDF